MPEAAGAFRVIVDPNKCQGYGVCAEICPDVYKLNDQGFAYVEADAPAELESAIMEARDNCPVEAITVERVDT
jgi:ferredoxin